MESHNKIYSETTADATAQVRLRTIDNYQGEEAKVIPTHMILSDIVDPQYLFRLSSCLL